MVGRKQEKVLLGTQTPLLIRNTVPGFLKADLRTPNSCSRPHFPGTVTAGVAC